MSRPRAYRHHMCRSHCGSNWVVKDGRPRGKQTYRCRERHYRFTRDDNRSHYSEQVKRDALSMYCEGMSVSAISRVMGASSWRTVYSWVKKVQQTEALVKLERKRRREQGRSESRVL